MTAKKPAKPRQKKLTLKQIQTEHKKLNTLSTFIYDEKANIVIKYYEQFSESKIDELLVEAYEALNYVEENKLDYFDEEYRFIMFVHFLIIKKFSDLGKDIPDDVPTQYYIMLQMYDKGYYHRLMNDMFDGNEVLRVIEKIEERVKLVHQINEAAQKELAKLDKLENKEILSKPFNVLSSPSPTDDVSE